MQNKTKLSTGKTISRSWNGLPGFMLFFPMSIAMSGAMTQEREKTIGLNKSEKSTALLDFRIRLVADILTDAPNMINLEKLPGILKEKQDKAITEAIKIEEGKPNYVPLEGEELEKFKAEIAAKNKNLTEKELAPHFELLPEWAETPGDTLYDKAYNYFSQTDENERHIFTLLIEDLVAAFWEWATPRPTISVSAFIQDMPLTFTTSSEG